MVVKRGRPKSKNPSEQTMKKRLYRLKQYLDKENQINEFKKQGVEIPDLSGSSLLKDFCTCYL